MPPGAGFIPPVGGMALSPKRGGLIPPVGHLGGGVSPLWVVLSPLFRDFIPPSGGGGGGVVTQTTPGWFYHPEGGGFNKGGAFIPQQGWL